MNKDNELGRAALESRIHYYMALLKTQYEALNATAELLNTTMKEYNKHLPKDTK